MVVSSIHLRGIKIELKIAPIAQSVSALDFNFERAV